MTLKHALQSFLWVAAFGSLAQLTAAAQAMNVYNDTSTTLEVKFDCGFLCDNSWTINAGDMKSRPNKSGNLFAKLDIPGYGCGIDVDTHGWVVATGSISTSLELTSYHQDGSVRDTCVL